MKTTLQMWKLLQDAKVKLVLENGIELTKNAFLDLVKTETPSRTIDLFIFRNSIEESELDKYLAYEQFKTEIRKDEEKQKIFCEIFSLTNYKTFKKQYSKLDSYPDIFYDENLRKTIIESQNYLCGLCERKLENMYPQLHHIDYNKSNCDIKNLVFLCPKCHGKTNHNRDFWQKILTE